MEKTIKEVHRGTIDIEFGTVKGETMKNNFAFALASL